MQGGLERFSPPSLLYFIAEAALGSQLRALEDDLGVAQVGRVEKGLSAGFSNFCVDQV
jgi:hypothetical protein